MITDPSMIHPDMVKLPVSKGALLGGAAIILAGVALVASTADDKKSSDPSQATPQVEGNGESINLEEQSFPQVGK